MRIEIWEGTYRACIDRGYKLPDSTLISFDMVRSADQIKEDIAHNVCYQETSFSDKDRKKFSSKVFVEVQERDCLEAAIELQTRYGLNPAVLNMASPRRPGGGMIY
jgi:hypothetical protein